MIHAVQIRVYYEDTDAGGIVYYANYLKYAERGRTEWLRARRLENSVLRGEEGILFVVRRVEADYHKPARLDDFLEVRSRVTGFKNASFSMDQEIWRGDEKLFGMKVDLACVDVNGKPARLPGKVRKALEDGQSG